MAPEEGAWSLLSQLELKICKFNHLGLSEKEREKRPELRSVLLSSASGQQLEATRAATDSNRH